jgi:hypothetical protein
MTQLSIKEIKEKFRSFINDWYSDILTDFRAELAHLANDKEVGGEELVTQAKMIDQWEIDRDKIQETLHQAQNLYDILKLITVLTDGNDYPFCEQEEIIFNDVFGIKIVADDIVQLVRHDVEVDDQFVKEVTKLDDYLAGEMLTGV